MQAQDVIVFNHAFEPIQRLLISDVHFDSSYCNRKLFFKDLKEAKKRNAKVRCAGDFFDLMESRKDPRSNKKNLRVENKHSNYLDKVVENAVNDLLPYLSILEFFSYGNHETAIIDHYETDLLLRFVTELNRAGGNVVLGSYSGWICDLFYRGEKTIASRRVFKTYFHHGYGGGGAVTKGTIQHNRQKVFVAGADIIWMGHTHDEYDLPYIEVSLNSSRRITKKRVNCIRTASYKDDFTSDSWATKKGMPPKPLGGRFLHITPKRVKSKTANKNNIILESFTEPTVKH
jgi:UDP-2,3-diacylglucosamine pyrophosphatase LpxH